MTEVNMAVTSDWGIRGGPSEESVMARGASPKEFWESAFQAKETKKPVQRPWRRVSRRRWHRTSEKQVGAELD